MKKILSAFTAIATYLPLFILLGEIAAFANKKLAAYQNGQTLPDPEIVLGV